jgi:hypothetical protein
MSNLFRRAVIQTLTKLGAESAVVQRVAQKAARAQHNFTSNTLVPASEKAGVWLGAAAREVILDLKAAATYLTSEGAPADPSVKGVRPKTASSPTGEKSGRQPPGP